MTACLHTNSGWNSTREAGCQQGLGWTHWAARLQSRWLGSMLTAAHLQKSCCRSRRQTQQSGRPSTGRRAPWPQWACGSGTPYPARDSTCNTARAWSDDGSCKWQCKGTVRTVKCTSSRNTTQTDRLPATTGSGAIERLACECAHLIQQLPGLAVIRIQRVAAARGAGSKCGHAAIGCAHDPDCGLAACIAKQHV
jgi:hypothetical protein